MPLTHLDDARTTGTPDPAEVITVTFGGKTFRCGRRTYAHLLWTQERLTQRDPLARIALIQGCYNTGVPASAGTHDQDGVVDVAITGGMSWRDGERFLRECGWAAWYRFPPAFPLHLHAVSIGCPGPVGVFVPGQVADCYAHRSGLKGHAADPTWHPADIDSTVFDYPAWVAEQEDNMPYTDWPKKDRKALAADVAAAILAAPVGGERDPATLKQAVNQIRTATKKAGK